MPTLTIIAWIKRLGVYPVGAFSMPKYEAYNLHSKRRGRDKCSQVQNFVIKLISVHISMAMAWGANVMTANNQITLLVQMLSSGRNNRRWKWWKMPWKHRQLNFQSSTAVMFDVHKKFISRAFQLCEELRLSMSLWHAIVLKFNKLKTEPGSPQTPYPVDVKHAESIEHACKLSVRLGSVLYCEAGSM